MEKGLKKRNIGQDPTEVLTTEPLLEDGAKKGENGKTNGKDKKKGTTWRGMWEKTRMLWPYMWPKKNVLHQLRIVFCLLILIAARGITVLIPIYYKKIINSMTPVISKNEAVSDEDVAGSDVTAAPVSEPPAPVTASYASSITTVIIQGIEFRWDYILIYMFLKSLHGPSGYLNIFRSFLWIRISQNTRKNMRVKLFKHLHSLSLRWHLQRKTGEVLRVMDRGVSSINLLLSQVLFSLLPVFADVLIAVVFFTAVFNVWTGLIVFSTMLGYVLSTVFITEWRTKYRRQYNDADNSRQASSVDSILNFETVKYHAAEEFEVDRYAISIDDQMNAEWLVTASMNLLNFLQKTMMSLGLLGGSLLVAWYVSEGELTIGDYVLFGSYVEQLYGPLNQFGAMYRNLQQAFVDMENMFDMLHEEQEIKDVPDAKAVSVSGGEIKFDRVNFFYNEKRAVLQNVSFTVPPGHTYALVGQSGGGKSTIIRLLLRFYDIQSGTISIDGQDISQVQMKSLREQLGVVPQDTVLFNDSVRYNIRYGKHTASDQEIEDAAAAADIHDKIVSLPDGYDSKVGERGLKLSGGEKQRVAIARTILKSPQIVLLDEATSALDTRTERNIQASLTRICENRTTLVVAHRLSTIIGADQILVLKDGEVVETGKHFELLSLGGLYWSMWQEQLDNDLTESDVSAEDLENSPTGQPSSSVCTCNHTTTDADNKETPSDSGNGDVKTRSCRKCSGEKLLVPLLEKGNGTDPDSNCAGSPQSDNSPANDDTMATRDVVISIDDKTVGYDDSSSSKA